MRRLLMVTWTDAAFDLDPPAEPYEDFQVVTVGFEVRRTSRFLVLAGEQTPVGDRAVTHIPTVCIAEVRELEPGIASE